MKLLVLGATGGTGREVITQTDGPRTGQYRVGERLVLRGILPRIARADVADFILTQLTSTAYRKKVAVISY